MWLVVLAVVALIGVTVWPWIWSSANRKSGLERLKEARTGRKMARARGEGGGRGGGQPRGVPSIPVGYGSRRTYTYTPGAGSRNQSPGGPGLPGGCGKIILWLIVIAVIAPNLDSRALRNVEFAKELAKLKPGFERLKEARTG